MLVQKVLRAVIPGDTVSPLSNVQLPTAAVAPSTSMADNASILASLRMLRVYLRTYALDQMVQAASSSAGLQTIKRVEQTLQELGLQYKEAEGSSFRDGSYADTPGTPKGKGLANGTRNGRPLEGHQKLHHLQLSLKGLEK